MINSSMKKNQIDSSSFTIQYYCKCSINGVQLLPQNIVNMNFAEWVFDIFPRLNLTIIDDGKYFDRFPIQENDIVKIEIAKNSSNDNGIVIEFNIVDYTLQPSDPNFSRNSVITISGIVKHTQLFHPVKTRSFSNSTSDKVLARIADDSGFKTDVRIRCSDSMKWLQANMNDFSMINYVLRGSFKTTSDATLCYVDRFSKFVYTSLNTELNNAVKFKFTHNPEKVLDIANTSDHPANIHKKSKGKELFYASYKVMNFSGSVNKMNAYGARSQYWNLGEIVKKDVVVDKHPLTKFSFKEKKNVGSLSTSDMLSYNSDNQHRNYQLAQTQNKFLRDNFFNTCLFVFINANDEIKLFDKVFMSLPTLDGGKDINEVHSGEYIVGGIYHEIGKDSIYKMMIALFRNGMNKSSYMKESDYRLNGG